MVRLLGWGDEAAAPRAATARGFVPQLETLGERVVPVANIKWGEALVSGSGVAAEQRIESPPPDVVLLGAPADPSGANGAAAPVHVQGGGESGFVPAGGTEWNLVKTGSKFHEW